MTRDGEYRERKDNRKMNMEEYYMDWFVFYSHSGLPVCAMRERVNRYDHSFRNILTAPEVYAILKIAGNYFLLS